MIDNWCKQNIVFRWKANMIGIQGSEPYQESESKYDIYYIMDAGKITI